MFALVASPTFKPAFDFAFLRETRPSEADKIADIITDLHGVLVNPEAAPGAAAAAKRTLLAVLDRTKGMRLPFMMVPPLAEPRDRETRKHPVAPPSSRASLPFPKTARVSSSASFRAKTLPSRGRRAFATTTRKSDLTNTPNTYDHTHRSTARH